MSKTIELPEEQIEDFGQFLNFKIQKLEKELGHTKVLRSKLLDSNSMSHIGQPDLSNLVKLKEAIEHLIISKEFKEMAKQKNAIGGRYRMFLSRYNKGQLKNGAAFDFLFQHGYSIDINKPKILPSP